MSQVTMLFFNKMGNDLWNWIKYCPPWIWISWFEIVACGYCTELYSTHKIHILYMYVAFCSFWVQNISMWLFQVVRHWETHVHYSLPEHAWTRTFTIRIPCAHKHIFISWSFNTLSRSEYIHLNICTLYFIA